MKPWWKENVSLQDQLTHLFHTFIEIKKEVAELTDTFESNEDPEESVLDPDASMEDELLKKLQRRNGRRWNRGSTVLWRPGGGRPVAEGTDSYMPFKHIVRVLHLEDALMVCLKKRMEPKPVMSFSSIDSRDLHPSHPCAKTKVLWFSAKCDGVDEEPSNWYGNVEFAVDAQILLRRWKYSFLVEMMTAPTHTTSRILVTNKDYSSVLPAYDYNTDGGPWRAQGNSQEALLQCSRYRSEGINKNDHILEFMIEATLDDERAILNASQISFKNHDKARFGHIPHVCNRFQRARQPCPTPFSIQETAENIFSMRGWLASVSYGVQRQLQRMTPATVIDTRFCELLLQKAVHQ